MVDCGTAAASFYTVRMRRKRKDTILATPILRLAYHPPVAVRLNKIIVVSARRSATYTRIFARTTNGSDTPAKTSPKRTPTVLRFCLLLAMFPTQRAN